MNSKSSKFSAYFFVPIVAIIVAWGIWKCLAYRTSNSIPLTGPSDQIRVGKPGEQLLGRPLVDSKPSGANERLGAERNITPTVKIVLVPVQNAPPVEEIDEPAPSPDWNKSHSFYLVESSGWYDLYDKQNKKIFRFPNFINVDAVGTPGAIDRPLNSIKWQWVDEFSVIGVQMIDRKPPAVVPPKGMDAEFPEKLPDATRFYLYDVRKTDTLQELVLPEVPKSMVVRLEAITHEAHLSLAALSSEAYDRGDDLKSDPNHYKYLGLYKITE